MQSEFAGKRCLVTGGTGFIGGRLIESLASDGAELRALVRDLSKSPRIARFDVQMVRGDLAERADVERAVEGCDYVFHCAFGNSGDLERMRTVTVDGTRHVVEACRKEGARLVHVSTVAVYGDTPDGTLDETAARNPGGDFYAETKLEAENAVLEAAGAGALQASVVQPTIVYGPFGPAWTVRTFDELKSGYVMLIDGGEGLCNAVYVDDIVRGLRLAASEEGALGEVFLLSGPEPVTWREFYGAHEALLGYESHVVRTAQEAEALFRSLYGDKHLWREMVSLVHEDPDLRTRFKTTREVQALLRVGRFFLPEGARKSIQRKLRGGLPPDAPTVNELVAATRPPDPDRTVHPMAPAGINLCKAKTVVSIDKARRLIGYEPMFDFPSGMARVAEWARWANVLEAPAASSTG